MRKEDTWDWDTNTLKTYYSWLCEIKKKHWGSVYLRVDTSTSTWVIEENETKNPQVNYNNEHLSSHE